MKYDIAGVRMVFHCDFSSSIGWLDEYLTDFSGEPDVEVYFKGATDIGFPDGKIIKDNGFSWCVTREGNISIAIHNPSIFDRVEVICRFDVEKDWTVINVSYLEHLPGIEENLITFLGNIILRYVILKHNGILLHASSVKWNGHGIAFTAPSGTGKSTHADLWRKLHGAVVLNDDSPALKLTDNGIFVYGTPWCGSRGINTNGNEHLDMIVVLEQASENSILRLERPQILSRLMPRFLMPLYDRELMNTAFDHIERIMEATPVYLLRCRPEKEAVDLVLGRL